MRKDKIAASLSDLLPTFGQGGLSSIGAPLAELIVKEHFGFEANAVPLTGERDDNFCVVIDGEPAFVLKIPAPLQPLAETELFMAVLRYVKDRAPDLPTPHLQATASGDDIFRFIDGTGATRVGLMCSFLPGIPLIEVERSSLLRVQCGALLAKLATVLHGFSHPAMHRPLAWDLKQLPRIAAMLPAIGDLPFEPFISAFLAAFTADIMPRLQRVPQQFVHNDFNARNLLVDVQDHARIAGVIDFGDAVHTARVADVAIGVIGQLASAETAEQSTREFVAAYCAVTPLVAEEHGLLRWLVAGRIVQNVIMTSWYRNHGPNRDHFADFGPPYFEWRIDFARRLVSEGGTGLS